jgi:hypothetical protein
MLLIVDYIVVKTFYFKFIIDPNYIEDKQELPVTLSPRLVHDRFAVRRAVDGQVCKYE